MFILALLFLGCEPEPDFPADYAKTFTEVRDCRPSAEHDSHNIRILASPAALGPYTTRDAGFPPGAIVLKEERDFGDVTCTGPVLQWTVMTRQADAGWQWQSVTAARHVQGTNESRCIGCHATCGSPPEGYEGTCAVP
ncbi:MAG: cytochrome P460 family protein [Archangium sp.]|nr:cytochrome P460 family protein [Archangium sp.]